MTFVPKWSRTSAVLFAAGILAVLLMAFVPQGARAQTSECYPAPVIYEQPEDQTISSGTQATLVVFSNLANVKWYRGNVGDKSTLVATTEVFKTPVLQVTTKYWAEISNTCGTLQTRQVTVTVVPSGPPGPCVTSDTTACLQSNRFRVVIDYVNPFSNPPNQPGTFTAAKLLPGVQQPDQATFGFGNAQAIEVVVRIQDTTPFGQPVFAVYYGGMTDVAYLVTVQDTSTGTLRQYSNPAGKITGRADRTSFPSNGTSTPSYALFEGDAPLIAPVAAANSPTGTCVATAKSVCLLNGRFEVKIDFVNPFSNPPNQPGTMDAAKLVAGAAVNPDTAIFGFGNPYATGIEAVVRLQDTRPFANRFDVYFGSMTDVPLTVTVIDKATGTTRTYFKPLGVTAGVGAVDRGSFAP
jgi:hypothetical protein